VVGQAVELQGWCVCSCGAFVSLASVSGISGFVFGTDVSMVRAGRLVALEGMVAGIVVRGVCGG
jgi:hypothetical protein